MTPPEGIKKREQLIRDGYCVLDNILTEDFLEELRGESDRLLDAVEHPPKWQYQGSDLHINGKDNSIIQKLIDWQPTRDAMHTLGLTDFKSHGGFILLSKPANGPPLYWHQDWMNWNDPISLAPWPQVLFFSYYMVDTTLENGCFRLIPGTHKKRIPLHDQVEIAHQETAYFADVNDPVMFGDHPGTIDVPAEAGSLVIGEGRVLHAARANKSNNRRTLLLGWHARPNTTPDYWREEVPEPIVKRPKNKVYEGTRVPGKYLI